MNEAQFRRSLARLPDASRQRFVALIDAGRAPALGESLGRPRQGLLTLRSPSRRRRAWRALFDPRCDDEAVSLLASPLPPAVVAAHLETVAMHLLPDDPYGLLAGWRVQVLRNLLQPGDDRTPVLSASQHDAVLAACTAWWFCQPDGTVCMVEGTLDRPAPVQVQALTRIQTEALRDRCRPGRPAVAQTMLAFAWPPSLPQRVAAAPTGDYSSSTRRGG